MAPAMQITLNRTVLMWLAVAGLIVAGAVLLIRGISGDDAGSSPNVAQRAR